MVKFVILKIIIYLNFRRQIMEKIRFGIIGGGWRSEFFVRIAKALPEIFEISAVMVRNPEKAEIYKEKMDVTVVNTIDEFLSYGMDYAILSVSRTAFLEYLKILYAKNIPVLCETPPSDDEAVMDEIWELTKKTNGKIQIAEQYLYQPIYASWLKAIEDGKIGEVQNITISALHDYHAVNVIRHYLGTGFEPCTIYATSHNFDVTETRSRKGDIYDGKIRQWYRIHGTVEFESGKVGYYDFSSVQYLTYIRTRQLNVQGVRGEIDDLEIRYLQDDNTPVKSSLDRIDLGQYNNYEWSHKGMMLDGEYLYKNPFANARINDDEIAIATCMYKMKDYIENGTEFYPLADALQDTYIANLIRKSAEKPLEIIKTEKKAWMD